MENFCTAFTYVMVGIPHNEATFTVYVYQYALKFPSQFHIIIVLYTYVHNHKLHNILHITIIIIY